MARPTMTEGMAALIQTIAVEMFAIWLIARALGL